MTLSSYNEFYFVIMNYWPYGLPYLSHKLIKLTLNVFHNMSRSTLQSILSVKTITSDKNSFLLKPFSLLHCISFGLKLTLETTPL